MRHFTNRSLKDALSSLKQKNQKNQVLLQDSIKNNADAVLHEVSTLYIGNLNETIDEETLAKVFGKFGTIRQIKLMLPRSDQDQKNLCAFIKFDCFSGAYLAKQHLHEHKLFGQNLKVVWSKNIVPVAKSYGWLDSYKGVADAQIELEYIESQLLIFLKLHGFEYQKRCNEVNLHQGELKIQVEIPSFEEDRRIINRVAKLVATHGQPFEVELIQKVNRQDIKNETLEKIFVWGNQKLLNYYTWRVFAYANFQSKVWSMRAFKIVENGAWWIPPICPFDPLFYLITTLIQKHEKEKEEAELTHQQSSQISDDEKPSSVLTMPQADLDQLTILLQNLNTKKNQICRAMVFILQRAKWSNQIVKRLHEHLVQQHDIGKKLAVMFLVSDLAYNAVRNLHWPLQKCLSEHMPNMLFNICNEINDNIQQKQCIAVLTSLIQVWKKGSLFQERVMQGWLSILLVKPNDNLSKNLSSYMQINQIPQVLANDIRESLSKTIKEFNGLNEQALTQMCRLRGLPTSENTTLMRTRLCALEEYLAVQIQVGKAVQEPDDEVTVKKAKSLIDQRPADSVLERQQTPELQPIVQQSAEKIKKQFSINSQQSIEGLKVPESMQIFGGVETEVDEIEIEESQLNEIVEFNWSKKRVVEGDKKVEKKQKSELERVKDEFYVMYDRLKQIRYKDYLHLRKVRHNMEDDLYDFKKRYPDDKEQQLQIEKDMFIRLLEKARKL